MPLRKENHLGEVSWHDEDTWCVVSSDTISQARDEARPASATKERPERVTRQRRRVERQTKRNERDSAPELEIVA